MDTPQHSMNVWATLTSGEEVMAYWLNGEWWEGLPDDPTDIPISDLVVSWREVT